MPISGRGVDKPRKRTRSFFTAIHPEVEQAIAKKFYDPIPRFDRKATDRIGYPLSMSLNISDIRRVLHIQHSYAPEEPLKRFSCPHTRTLGCDACLEAKRTCPIKSWTVCSKCAPAAAINWSTPALDRKSELRLGLVGDKTACVFPVTAFSTRTRDEDIPKMGLEDKASKRRRNRVDRNLPKAPTAGPSRRRKSKEPATSAVLDVPIGAGRLNITPSDEEVRIVEDFLAEVSRRRGTEKLAMLPKLVASDLVLDHAQILFQAEVRVIAILAVMRRCVLASEAAPQTLDAPTKSRKGKALAKRKPSAQSAASGGASIIPGTDAQERDLLEAASALLELSRLRGTRKSLDSPFTTPPPVDLTSGSTTAVSSTNVTPTKILIPIGELLKRDRESRSATPSRASLTMPTKTSPPRELPGSGATHAQVPEIVVTIADDEVVEVPPPTPTRASRQSTRLANQRAGKRTREEEPAVNAPAEPEEAARRHIKRRRRI